MEINLFLSPQWYCEEDWSVWIRRLWVHQSSFDVCRRMRLILVSQLCILLVLPFNAWKTHYQSGYNEPFDICQLQKSAQYFVFVDWKSQLLHTSLTIKNETRFQTIVSKFSYTGLAAYWWVTKLSFSFEETTYHCF